MLDPIEPILPPGVADRFIELYVIGPLFAAGALYALYWFLRSLHFHAKNGWNFSKDFGPLIIDEATQKPVRGVQKLISLTVFMIIFAGFAALIFFAPRSLP